MVIKHGEAEAKTDVTFFFVKHTPECLQALKEHCEEKRPKFLIVEGVRSDKFLPMLRNEITIDDYTKDLRERGIGTFYPELVRKRCEVFRELYGKGIEIEQMGSAIDESHMLELRKQELLLYVFEKGGYWEGAVGAEIASERSRAEWAKGSDRRTAEEMAKRIGGEWHGSIVIEFGGAHTLMMHELKKGLEKAGGVGVSFMYTERKLSEEVFGRGIAKVYDPLTELERMFRFEKEVSEERANLLGGRGVIFDLITGPGLDEVGKQAIKLVNRLEYKECEEIFNAIHRMNNVEAFMHVEEYLKGRDGKSGMVR